MPRRSVLLAAPALLAAPGAGAAAPAGAVVEVVGRAEALRGAAARRLAPAAALTEGETLVTAAESRLLARLTDGVELRLGPLTRMVLEAVGQARTVLRHRGGPFLFSRPPEAPRGPVALVSPAALIAVRGTEVWGGESQGRFAVFVARGAAEVTAGGLRIALAAGEGTDLDGSGRPTPPAAWAPARLAAALAAVGAPAGPGP